MELVDHILHVGVAVRESFLSEIPVAFGDLVSVIKSSPLEAELLDFRESSDDFVYSEPALISPCAPCGLIGLRATDRHLDSDSVEQACVVAQSSETVALVDADEACICRQSSVRSEYDRLIEVLYDGDLGEVAA